MRFCNQCKHITAGDPLYCQHCGGTYNRKICSRGHVSPRAAKVCSVCGSEELSTPQPKINWLLRPFIFALDLLFGHGLGGFLLCCIVAAACYFAYRLYTNPFDLLPSMCTIFALGLLFLLWMRLTPKPVRHLASKGIRKLLAPKGRGGDHERH